MSNQPVSIHDSILDTSARHIVPLSGGKDSTALSIYLTRNYPEIDFEFVFSDTGAELPEAYDYFERLEHVLGKKITRITALDMLGVEEKQGRSPFDVILYEHFSGFLPSPRSRWCTRMLKIHPYEKYIGSDKAYSYIAIRSDENRSGYLNKGRPVLLSEEPNIIPVYPFKDDGVTIDDVKMMLDDSGLGIPEYYEWRSRSGCYFCFYQQIGEWQGLQERHPQLFEKAKSYEQGQNGRKFSWVDGRSLDDVAKMPRKKMKPKSDDDGCAICHL
ncbi:MULTISPECIES: phosphoadenosine phosphosulfate reductase family protein [unclassified Aminobacter]|uniref:phosphoadenosine phosphosulfate reductase domain-containing protein n=1 Tax=unclassified Aminobacter TaxID=2644704 RepID=UPI000466ECCC|nr:MULTISPECIES: phosphoadenosine phosphosulfate reductase family protein [unclassified Aminobacter]TWH28800.1 3'-phosphoadenosine 5'-phosphosulfate sulfotransferase (PAPS reductase)/FAD synthetase and related enzymes [Aminobacter sp. J15]